METSFVDYEQLSRDYRRVEDAIVYLEEHYREQPSLEAIAESVHLSEYHFQRLFTRWVGISPKRFLQYLTKERAKELLEESESVLDTAYATGLSGPGRLHDLFVTCEAVTPGDYKNRGEDLEIFHGFHPSPFGECLLALTDKGICSLIFVEEDRKKALAELKKRWAKARLQEDPERTAPVVEQIFRRLAGGESAPLSLYLEGTNFQIKVWEALLRIPSGRVVSYEDLAVSVGMPRAARAVSNAVARNPLPVIIPCHRVIRKMGDFGGYRWGTARKKALLGWEAAQSQRRVEGARVT
ncbi:MAG: methylated-DNA--[protein]-cysteine S-methyltransferase [Anaerolineales bacterium]|jgi:AraC family transcriptional regulator of adaptative response/methylated-DNA-[protein]-cysteine methyltransferase